MRTLSAAFLRSINAVGLTCLAAAFFTALVFQAGYPNAVIWPAMIAILPMAVLLWWNGRSTSALSAALYVVVGLFCTYWYVLTFAALEDPLTSGDAFSSALPKIAMMMVATRGGGLVRGLGWPLAGCIAGVLASLAALYQLRAGWQLDYTTLSAFLALAGIHLVSHLVTIRFSRAQPLLHRAVRDEWLATARYQVEAGAAALIHDTVLSHLAAISRAPGDDLKPELAREIRHDLEVLVGQEWLGAGPDDAAAEPSSQQTHFVAAVDHARAEGLTVQLTGELSALGRLSQERAREAALAVRQCLSNVSRHSGTDLAEVLVYSGGEREISIMVIDSGRGFSESGIDHDRIGIRHSIRRRIELAGGSVEVWSTPGQGTSIMITLPAEAEQRAVR